MTKKLSYRVFVALALGCMMTGLILWGAGSAGAVSNFSLSQQWNISSDTWSFIAEVNGDTGDIFYSDWNVGSWVYDWSLPYNLLYGFFIYDFEAGRYQEAVLVYDYAL